SFRFNQHIADLASKTLNLKKLVSKFDPFPINGLGSCDTVKSKAIIARTNVGLLTSAIEYVEKKQKASSIYFEGSLNSYTYASDGASLYDVLNLYEDKSHLIRNSLIKRMNNLDDLE